MNIKAEQRQYIEQLFQSVDRSVLRCLRLCKVDIVTSNGVQKLALESACAQQMKGMQQYHVEIAKAAYELGLHSVIFRTTGKLDLEMTGKAAAEISFCQAYLASSDLLPHAKNP